MQNNDSFDKSSTRVITTNIYVPYKQIITIILNYTALIVYNENEIFFGDYVIIFFGRRAGSRFCEALGKIIFYCSLIYNLFWKSMPKYFNAYKNKIFYLYEY